MTCTGIFLGFLLQFYDDIEFGGHKRRIFIEFIRSNKRILNFKLNIEKVVHDAARIESNFMLEVFRLCKNRDSR